MSEKRAQASNRPQAKNMNWDYTVHAVDFAKWMEQHQVKKDADGQKFDTYKGYRVIGRDTPINRGVYFTTHGEEIVVDDEKDHRLKPIYDKVLREIARLHSRGESYKSKILDYIYYLVKGVMPNGSYQDDEKIRPDLRVNPNGTVFLGEFFGGGVCRHQALLIGYLIEKLIQGGYLQGEISVDRNHDGIDGHAWPRYTTRAGVRIILDTAQNFKGELNPKNTKTWPYARPEDLGFPPKKSASQEARNPKLNGFKLFQRQLRKLFVPNLVTSSQY